MLVNIILLPLKILVYFGSTLQISVNGYDGFLSEVNWDWLKLPSDLQTSRIDNVLIDCKSQELLNCRNHKSLLTATIITVITLSIYRIQCKCGPHTACNCKYLCMNCTANKLYVPLTNVCCYEYLQWFCQPFLHLYLPERHTERLL